MHQPLVRGDGALPNGSVTHLLSEIYNPNEKNQNHLLKIQIKHFSHYDTQP